MAAPTESPVLNHMQLKDRVYEHLRRTIIEGEYAVGAALREVDISTALGVSKTPVREALVRLQSDRFVELIPYRGAVVKGYSRRDVREMYEVREIVEGRCAARMADSDDGAARGELQRNVKETWDAVGRGDIDSVIALFEKFDSLVYAHAENRWFADLIDDLEGHQRRIGRPTVEIPGRIERSTQQHEAICDAIVARDSVAAEAAMREHVRSVLADRLGNFADDDAA